MGEMLWTSKTFAILNMYDKYHFLMRLIFETLIFQCDEDYSLEFNIGKFNIDA